LKSSFSGANTGAPAPAINGIECPNSGYFKKSGETKQSEKCRMKI